MKKILIIISLFTITFGLYGCGSKEKYEVLANEANSEPSYNKIVVNDLQQLPRQTNVLADPETTILYELPSINNTVGSVINKTSILNENNNLFNFDYLDIDGYYIKDGIKSSTRLYKSRGADTQYHTSLKDDIAVSKNMTIRNYIYTKTESFEALAPVNTTGLYAPAGEVIKVEISEELLSYNPKLYIGMSSVTGHSNDIPDSANYTRMPFMTKVIELNNTINYVGNPLGGQIYIQADKDEFDVTITGAVEYMHYIHNDTTKEELSRLYDSSAPMIDIEIPEHLRINMPKSEIIKFEDSVYNDLTSGLKYRFNENEYREKAKNIVIETIFELCEKFKAYCELSDYLCPSELYRTNNITIFYDRYINNETTGKGFTTYDVNEASRLYDYNYDKFQIIKDYNSHFWNNFMFLEQGSSDVTSEVLSILSYMLYGKYGEFRSNGNLSGNHQYSNAGTTLNILNTATTGVRFEIAKYVTLMHSFSAQTFIKAITSNSNIVNITDRLYSQFSLTTNLNMQYYFEEMLGWSLSADVKESISQTCTTMFIPVTCDGQIGSVFNNENFYTSQVYGLYESESINLNKDIIVPKGMSYDILNVGTTKGELLTIDNEVHYVANHEGIDEFTVDVKVYNEEYEYTTTLIMGVALQYQIEQGLSPVLNFYDNAKNLSLDEYTMNDLTLNTSFTAVQGPVTGCDVKTGYNGIFICYGEIYFPETKEYTLNVAGLGDVRVSVGTTYYDLKEVVRFKQEGSGNSYDINDQSRTFKVNATKNQRVTVKIEVSSVAYGANQRIQYSLGYLNGNTVSNIPNNWWYKQYRCDKDVVTDYYKPYNTKSLYQKESFVSSYTTVREDLNIIYQTGVLDDKFLTTPNSDKQSMEAGSVVVYKYKKEVIANFVAITSASPVEGVLSFFEVHVSNNGVNWTEAYNGLNPNNVYNRIALNDAYSFQYVKLVFYSQYTGKFIDICNFDFQLRVDEAKVIDCSNDLFMYRGHVELVESKNSLNNNIVEFNGEIRFSFTGSSIVLFGNKSKYYGVIEIEVNGKKYEVDLRSRTEEIGVQLLAVSALEHGTYNVIVRTKSGLSNLDYIAIE